MTGLLALEAEHCTKVSSTLDARLTKLVECHAIVVLQLN